MQTLLFSSDENWKIRQNFWIRSQRYICWAALHDRNAWLRAAVSVGCNPQNCKFRVCMHISLSHSFIRLNGQFGFCCGCYCNISFISWSFSLAVARVAARNTGMCRMWCKSISFCEWNAIVLRKHIIIIVFILFIIIFFVICWANSIKFIYFVYFVICQKKCVYGTIYKHNWNCVERLAGQYMCWLMRELGSRARENGNHLAVAWVT